MEALRAYRNKRVVVTGCFSGIGQATARALLDLGAEVHGLDLKSNDLPLRSFTQLDLRDPAAIEAAAASIGGRVDALFNCAGVPPGLPPGDVFKVNFVGTRHLTDHLVPLMPAGGAIVNVASNGGLGWAGNVPELLQLIATPSFDAAVAWFEDRAGAIPAAYSFSKQAIIVWTMAASAVLIKRGIRMNCISPGAVQTPMLVEIEKSVPTAAIDMMAQPIGRRSSPEEQALPLIFLNSDAASYINGVLLPVDGGFMGARAVADPAGQTDLGRQ